MREKIESKLKKIIIVILIVSLFCGLMMKLFINEQAEEYDEIEENNYTLVPEHYIENQIAFIGWEELYKHFPSIRGAENFKKDLIVTLLEKRPKIRCWFLEDVSYQNNVLSFILSYNQVKFRVNMNQYQTIIVKE